MTLTMLVTLLHVLTAFLLVSGLVGRGVTLRAAARAADIHAVDALVRLAGQFEQMVRIPSLVVLGLGLWAGWRAGWPILGFLQGGQVNWLLASLILYLTLVPLIVWVFLPRGRRFEEALRGALAQGRVTPALAEAFADPVVAAAHAWELIAIGLIIVLMVTKPF
jgi:Predicted integral membrane protein (DUF2269)